MYNPGRKISLLLLNHFYPAAEPYRRVQKEKAATCCIRFGRSLWSANQLPARGVKIDVLSDFSFVQKCLTYTVIVHKN